MVQTTETGAQGSNQFGHKLAEERKLGLTFQGYHGVRWGVGPERISHPGSRQNPQVMVPRPQAWDSKDMHIWPLSPGGPSAGPGIWDQSCFYRPPGEPTSDVPPPLWPLRREPSITVHMWLMPVHPRSPCPPASCPCPGCPSCGSSTLGEGTKQRIPGSGRQWTMARQVCDGLRRR